MIRFILTLSFTIFVLGCNLTSKSNSNLENLSSRANTSYTQQQTESKSKWVNQEIGSQSLLTDFPEFWSYRGNESEEADKNKFNLRLREIEKSNKLNKSENISDDISYKGKNHFVPYYDSFYSLKKEKGLPNFDLIKRFYFNEKTTISIYKKENYNQSSGILQRLDLVIHDGQKGLVDGLNICLIGSGDQHAYSNNFYINNGIIYLRNFYIYEGESSSSRIVKYKILNSGNVVPYFEQKEGKFNSKSEKGEIKNNTKTGDWIEIKYNRFLGENTYLMAKYKEGKPIGKWNYYNLADNNRKGSKLLMIEEYSEEGKLLKRKIFENK